MNIGYYFIGVDKIALKGDVIQILNLLEYYNIDCMNMTNQDGIVRFDLISPSTAKLKKLPLEQNNIQMEIEQQRGLPIFLMKLLKRPGLAAGLLIFVFSMWVYNNFVFDIKFEGNQSLSEEYLLEALEKRGFKIGSYIPSFDFGVLANDICIDCPDVSWIFVNMLGNVAHVSVREYDKNQVTKPPYDNNDMTNLVAVKDGQIYRFEVSHGIVIMSPGQTAVKGDVLVSGCHKGEKADYKGRSVGKVFARTYHEFSFTIEREQTSLYEKERIEVEKWVEILDFRINISKKGSNFDTEYDIIEESSKLTLPKGAELPISINKRFAVIYLEQKQTLDDSQLMHMAQLRLSQEISERLGDAPVLSMDKNMEITQDGITVTCGIYTIENIAEEIPFAPVTEENTNK